LRDKLYSIRIALHDARDRVSSAIADEEHVTHFDRTSRLHEQSGQ
jgi:hypothetical protein